MCGILKWQRGVGYLEAGVRHKNCRENLSERLCVGCHEKKTKRVFQILISMR